MPVLWKASIPVKTVSPNVNEHWTARKTRNDTIRKWTWYFWLKDKPHIILPCTVKLCRVGDKLLDKHDNLPMSLKGTVDILADFILPNMAAGKADNDARITWEYDQRKLASKEKPAIEVTIYKD